MQERRDFLSKALRAGAGLAAVAVGSLLAPVGAQAKKLEEQVEEVTAPEDLMREHGVLHRLLLIYDHTLQSLDGRGPFQPRPLHAAAGLVRRFIEHYHEENEEKDLFPRFRKARTLVELVDTLEAQHHAGRRITADILALATDATLQDPQRQERLARALRKFTTMYRPHGAREDTVLFPALRSIVSAHEFEALGETFEQREHAHFGPDGFEDILGQVADLEKQLGLDDLNQFTPR